VRSPVGFHASAIAEENRWIVTAVKGEGPGSAATDREALKTVGADKLDGSLSKPSPKQTQASWRGVLPVHPAAELFPMMSRHELLELGNDIKKNGLKVPVILWSPNNGRDHYLLDGRNRLDAMELVGLPTVYPSEATWLWRAISQGRIIRPGWPFPCGMREP
jgi:hypothetical protein